MLYFLVESLGWFVVTILLIVMIALYIRLHHQFAKLRHNLIQLQQELQQHKDSFNYYKSERYYESKQVVRAEPTIKPASTSDELSENLAKPLAPLPLTDIFATDTPANTQSPVKRNNNKHTNNYPIYTFSEPKVIAHSLQPLSKPIIDNISKQSTLVASAEVVDNTATQASPKLYNRKSKSAEAILTKEASVTPVMEPDERSLPIVTSLFNSLKNWFFGGNLVVRVGVLVLLIGVVLLLRLVSEYVEIPIEIKLAAIAVAGLGLAGLGLKLATKRFAYGVTLQGAGLAIVYLTTFFAYDAYEVIASLPSFITLGIISAATIALAVRQNAFPLALLALSGGFFAPLLTATNTGSLTALFSYYLLLNITVAIIAHYRTWKVLNVLGVAVTFGLAYYFGGFATIATEIEAQRWSLTLLVALNVALYLFVAIRYTQQIIAYNLAHEAANASIAADLEPVRSLYLYPLDIGLLFSVPVLAFGLFAALLHDIEHALTITSAILGAIYLGLGWLLIRRSQRYALITEGMLALGFGFLALVIPLAFDAEWVAVGWSIQGLALVWFGRRSLRTWLVIAGLLLQITSVGVLFLYSIFSDATTLALSISAIASLAAMFILRASNSPSAWIKANLQANGISADADINTNVNATPIKNDSRDNITKYANSLGISTQAAQQWLLSINSQSAAFKLLWQDRALTYILSFAAVCWTLLVLVVIIDDWLSDWNVATSTLIALAALISLSGYWLINRYREWQEIRHYSPALLAIFYVLLILQLPQKFEFNYQWLAADWIIFAILLSGWAIVGQLWLKTWYSNAAISTSGANTNSHTDKLSDSLAVFNYSSWLGTGVLVLAAAVHYGLPDTDGVMAALIASLLLIVLMRFAPRKFASLLQWLDWQRALIGCSFVFIPLLLIWVTISNFYQDGVVWSLPYIPVLNLYDIAILLALAYGLGMYHLYQNALATEFPNSSLDANVSGSSGYISILLKAIGIIGFWVLSSILVRTLHAYASTPLWVNGAWGDDKVQTSLTILWTLTALIATFMSSRNGKRFWWLMGIGLLGVVVVKLVLVDLSQTGAILRVISFLVAGSLILLIGYLAPLPPAMDESVKEGNDIKKQSG